MTKCDILKIAREANLYASSKTNDTYEWNELRDEHFAALVAAAERNKIATWAMEKGYATGHGDTVEQMLEELEWQIRERGEGKL